MKIDQDLLVAPIPPLSEAPGWDRVPIVECGEPLVPLPIEDTRLRWRALYAEQGIPNAPDIVWVRATVRDRLLQAVQALPASLALVVFDGYRPLAVQQFLWDHYIEKIGTNQSHLTPEEVITVVRRFVAPPTASHAAPPPHRTGGAVDVYLVDRATGEPLPMGTEPDEAAPESATCYFEEHPVAPVTENRRLLFHAMTNAGFANYLGEWWHFDFGNQRWANITGAPHAVYGVTDDPLWQRSDPGI